MGRHCGGRVALRLRAAWVVAPVLITTDRRSLPKELDLQSGVCNQLAPGQERGWWSGIPGATHLYDQSPTIQHVQ